MWSESEQHWIGWERKRGKLEQLNQFLIGESTPELEGFLYAGDRAQLEGIRFVITLDADTQLLRDTARRMIETLAHPLNQARLSPDGRRVVRGYTIIQPSVSASLPSATATWFSRIFADPRGIDPYTHAVSDVYQDLVGEGSYHGKGIYELQTFHRLLSGRFPTAHLLSHDLLEGCHVRVGLATDIELLDVFPNSYIAWWSRQHRWIRGDWQIIDWLKSCVPRGRRSDGTQSAFRFQPLEDLRQSAPESGATGDRGRPPGGLVFHACSDALERNHRRSDVVAGPECFPGTIIPSATARNEILARPARPPAALFVRRDFSGGLRGHGTRCDRSRHLPANDVASAAPGMGDGGRCSPAREKSATTIYSQQTLDSRCLRAPFRRRSVAGNRGDGSRRTIPPLGSSLSGGGNGDQSASEELAWRNADVG